MKALTRKLRRDVWRLRGQVLSIALVLASGVAAILSLVGTYRSLSSSRDAYYDRYGFPDAFVHLLRAPESVQAKLRAVPGVASLETRLVEPVTFPLPGLLRAPTGYALSLASGPDGTRGLVLRRGRWLEPTHGNEVLVLEAFAAAHGLEPGDHLDTVIAGKRLRLLIVGLVLAPEYVFASVGGFTIARDVGIVWLSRDALADASGKHGAFDDVTFRLAPSASRVAVLADVDRVLDAWGGLGAYARDQQTSNKLLSGEIEQLQVLATQVPIVFLLVAAFLLNVALNRIVQLQREQIAVLRALGYTRFAIARHVLAFAAVVVALGTVLGLVLGVVMGGLLIDVYAGFFHFPVLDFTLDGDLIAFALATALGAALVGALSAAWRAARLRPAEAMQPPAPPRYRRGLVTRLGVDRLLGPMGRMVARELERRPGAMVVSVVGIAFAGALVVLGRFGLDSFDQMLDVSLARAMREDVMVMLREPMPRTELSWFRAAPGVVHVEPIGMTPIRIVAGPRHRDGVLTSFTADARLRRVLGHDATPVRVPPDGVMLTAILAERLGLRVGDPVRIERRDGDRRIVTTTVAALVEDEAGLNVYMDQVAAARALGEQPMFSAVVLQVEAPARATLLRALGTVPAVGLVQEQRVIRRAIEAQTGEMMSIWTLMTIVFALVIAMGVIYNNARVALSERGRDLATLRVLGYTRDEVASVLLGQLVVHTLVALPVGMLFGYGLAQMFMHGFDPEQYRMSLAVAAKTYALASLVVIGASLATWTFVRRRLDRIDLLDALDARE